MHFIRPDNKKRRVLDEYGNRIKIGRGEALPPGATEFEEQTGGGPGIWDKLEALRRLFGEQGMSLTVRDQAEKLSEELYDACRSGEITEGEYVDGVKVIGDMYKYEAPVYPSETPSETQENISWGLYRGRPYIYYGTTGTSQTGAEPWGEPFIFASGFSYNQQMIVLRSRGNDYEYLGRYGEWHRYDVANNYIAPFTDAPPATTDGEEVWSEEYILSTGQRIRVNNQGYIDYL